MIQNKLIIPLDVPKQMHDQYLKNYEAITHGTHRLMLFSCDQKIEHLNADFYGPEIEPEINSPEHLFKIGQNGRIGAMATQLGLIARYGAKYNNINYIVKLNSKTNLIPTRVKDPLSSQLWTVQDIVEFKNYSDIPIRGVGYTIYIGSEYEHIMLTQAAQIIAQAHKHGLITILWIYPRGKNISEETDGQLIAGAAGIAHSLGSDFVKIHAPAGINNKTEADQLKIITQAAGNTKVICAGGHRVSQQDFLEELYNQINHGNTAGCATGRNIFQRSEKEAVALTQAISSIVYDNASVSDAIKFLK